MKFLDGDLSIRINSGIYFLMATNNPNQIDPRIIKRPGRLDILTKIGGIQNEYLIKVFNLHSKYKIPNLSNRINEFGIMTGAQVKEVLQRSYNVAAQHNMKLSVDLLLQIKSKLFEDLTNQFDETNFETLYNKKSKIGFSRDYETAISDPVILGLN